MTSTVMRTTARVETATSTMESAKWTGDFRGSSHQCAPFSSHLPGVVVVVVVVGGGSSSGGANAIGDEKATKEAGKQCTYTMNGVNCTACGCLSQQCSQSTAARDELNVRDTKLSE